MALNAEQVAAVQTIQAIADPTERRKAVQEAAPELFPAPAGDSGRVAVWIAAFAILSLIGLGAMVGYIWLELEDKGGEEIIAIASAVVGGIVGCFVPQPRAASGG